ncbi:MAG: prepilin peptidase, partial [Rhodospirillales bacterium]|nr:prepilin peptidase [Rhodospirillales bacterium]
SRQRPRAGGRFMTMLLAAAVMGLVFGSFVTAASHRLPLDLPLGGTARSRCPACEHPLTPGELVPVLSWLASRGRCRHCGAAISWRYPLIELATAALFALAWAVSPAPAEAVVLALMVTALMVMIVADLEAGIIPDAVVLALVPLGVIWRWLVDWAPQDMALGLLAGLAVGLGLRHGFHLLKGRHGLGLGDVKFLAAAGIVLGLNGLALYLVASGLLGIVFGVAWRISGRGPVFPFGPALATALLVWLMLPQRAALSGILRF